MSKNSILTVSNNIKRSIKNSINLNISIDEKKHGIDIVGYVDSFLEKILFNNSDIRWVVFDLNTATDNPEDLIILNSFLPHHIYNKYTNLNFIFITSGKVFGDDIWNKTEIDSHTTKSLYSRSISAGEVNGDRSWVLRCDVFDEDFLNRDFEKSKVYYGSVDRKYSYVTNKALNKIIESLIGDEEIIPNGIYHIVPKDTHSEYELLNYLCWNKKSDSYIERSSSTKPIENILKTCKPDLLKLIWKKSGYEEIPTFKKLFDELF